MNELMARPAFHIYALCCAVLVLQLFALAGMQGAGRGSVNVYRNPEDVPKDAEKAKTAKVQTVDHDVIARRGRVHMNGVENFGPFAVIGLLYVLMGATPRMAAILMGTYVAARFAHMFVYLAGKQPWRTIFYLVGTLATTAMLVQVVRAALVYI